MGTVIYGESSSDYYYVGMNNLDEMILISRNNARAVLDRKNSVATANRNITVHIEYSNGVHKITVNNQQLSVSNSEHDCTYFLGSLTYNITPSNYKIKPL